MSDAEFWERVFAYREHGLDEFAYVDPPEMLVGWCLRCGCALLAEDYQQLRIIIDEDRELCDDCADELTEVPDYEPWDEAR